MRNVLLLFGIIRKWSNWNICTMIVSNSNLQFLLRKWHFVASHVRQNYYRYLCRKNFFSLCLLTFRWWRHVCKHLQNKQEPINLGSISVHHTVSEILSTRKKNDKIYRSNILSSSVYLVLTSVLLFGVATRLRKWEFIGGIIYLLYTLL